MTDLGTELTNAEIEEVESHLESSAPLLLELKSSPGSPKMNPHRIDMLEEKPQPEKCQDDGRFTCIGKVIDTYRDERTWQYGVAPATVLYVVLLCITQGNLRFDQVLIATPMIAGCYIPAGRSALQSLWPFFMTGLTYDAMKYITPLVHRYNPPHIREPYRAEQFLFGIETSDGSKMIPS